MRGLSSGSHRRLGRDEHGAGVRSRLRRHAALVLLAAAAAVAVVGIAAWTALRPASTGSEPLPEPIQVATVPGPSIETRPSPAPAPAPDVQPPPEPAPAPPVAPPTSQDAPLERVPADVVPPPPLPDDDADDGDDDGNDDDDDDGAGDDGAED